MQDGAGTITQQVEKFGGFPRDPQQPSNQQDSQNIIPQTYADTMSELIRTARGAEKDTISPGSKVPFSPNLVDTSGRYPKQLIGGDNEELYAQQQGWWNKMWNGLTKGLATAGTTALESTIGTIYGVGNAITTGKFSALYDNPFNRELDNWTKSIDTTLPNYYTHKEQDADWYSPSSWFTANFLLDKMIKNVGFAAGAALGGMGWGAALRGIGLSAKLFQAGKYLEFQGALESSLADVPKAERLSAFTDIVNDFSKKYAYQPIGSFLTKADRVLATGLSTIGQSGIIALGDINEFRNKAIKDFRDKNGYDATGDDLANINKMAEHVGNWSFGLNTALFTAGNYQLFPKILGSSYSAEKAILNGAATQPLEKDLETGLYKSALPAGGFGKKIYQAKNLGGLLFNPVGAAEFGAMGSISTGVQNYFDKKLKNGKASWLEDGLGYGISQTLDTKAGIEQLLMGGLATGMLQHAPWGERPIKERGFTGYGGERARATDEAIQSLNATNFKERIKAFAEYAKAGQISNELRQRSIRQGDILESKEQEFDFTHSYLLPRIKYGMFDDVLRDIQEYRLRASSDEGFERMKQDGLASPEDTKEAYLKRMDSIQREAIETNKLYKELHTKYGGLYEKGKEGEQPKRSYSDEAIEKLVYAGAKIRDYDNRIPEITKTLMAAGISVQPALDTVYLQGHPSESATRDALNQINNLDVTVDQKDNLKQALQDTLELGLRRREMLGEYAKIVRNPEKYTSQTFSMQEISQDKVIVPQIDKEGKITTKELETNKPYPLETPVLREGNKLSLFPKLTVQSATLGGEYQITSPTGESKFVKPEDLADYNLSDIANESQPLRDTIDKAIDKVAGREKYKDLGIPKEGDKIAFINSLDNKGLVDDVQEQINKDVEEFQKRQEEIRKELERAAKEKGLQETLERGQGTSTNTADSSGNKDTIISGDKQRDKDEGFRKRTETVTSSTTSSSEEKEPDSKSSPRIVRERNYLFNWSSFPNSGDMRAMIITVNQEKAKNLEGLAFEVAKTDPDRKDYELDNIEKGPVLAVYVDNKGNYVGEDGKPIGKIGEKVDINKLVVSTLTNTSLGTSGGHTKFREDVPLDKQNEIMRDWKEQRAKIFAQTDTKEPVQFYVSRGIPEYDSYTEDDVVKYRDNTPNGTLFGKEDASTVLSTPKVIEVATTSDISHYGIKYSTEPGRVYFRYKDKFAPLTNRKFSAEEIDNLYNILKAWSAKPDSEAFPTFLQNILYLKRPEEGKPATGNNQVYVDKDLHLNFQGKRIPFSPTSVEENESVIKDWLKGVYSNTNAKTLGREVTDPFYEITGINSEGNPVAKKWKNYQEFLMNDEKPYLTTPVRKLSPEVPNDRNFRQKYAVLNIESPKEGKVAEKKAEPTTPPAEKKLTPKEDFTTKWGDKLKFQRDEQGKMVVSEEGDYAKTIKYLVDNVPYVEMFANKAGISKEEAAKIALPELIESKLKADKLDPSRVEKPIEAAPKEEVKPAEEKKEPITGKRPKSPDRSGSEFRAAPFTNVDRMSESERKEFSSFMKTNLPQFTVKEIGNLIEMAPNRYAWGKMENGVITLYRAAEKGTGYHEAFEGVWKYFVPGGDQQAIIDEVRNREGSFKDRLTGEELPYYLGTDKQLKERIADEFADYRFGKRDRTIGQKVRDLFDRIIKFFKTFLTGYKGDKPLTEKLFKQIESGAFRKYKMPRGGSAEFKPVEGLSAAETHGFVNDIFTSFINNILVDGRDMFNINEQSGDDIFNKIKEEDYADAIKDFPEGQVTWDKLVSKTKDKLHSLNVTFDENNQVSINGENQTMVGYNPYDDKFSIDVKRSQPFPVKLILSTLPRTDSEGKPKGSITNGFDPLPYSKVSSNLYEVLHGITSVDDMVDRMRNLAKNDPDYIRLVRKLGVEKEGSLQNLTGNQIKLLNAFYDVFNKQKPDPYSFSYEGDGNETRMNPMDIGSSANATKNKWINYIRSKARKGESIFVKFDPTKRLYTVDRKLIQEAKGQNTVEFLSKLGLDIHKDWDKLNADQRGVIDSSKNSIVEYIGKQGGLKQIRGKLLGISGPLMDIAETIVRANRPDSETTVQNGEGEQRQSYVEPNYVSQFSSVFNSVKNLAELKQVMPHLNDVYARNSLLLKLGGAYFNEKGERTDKPLNLGYVDYITTDRGRNKLLKDATYPERLETQVNAILQGQSYISVPADGSTEWMTDVKPAVRYDELLYEDNKAIDILKGYLQDEVDLAKENRSNISNIGDRAKELRFFKKIGTTEEEMRAYINKEIDELGKNLEDNGIITKLGDRRMWPGLVDNFANDNKLPKNMSVEQAGRVLRTIVINNLISNMEMYKVVFGDPYAFKEDQLKRIKSWLSPAKPTMTADWYNEKYNQDFNTVAGVKLTSPQLGQYVPRDYVNSATIKEVEIENPTLGFKGVKEADAQAWHTMEMHRDMQQRHWKWLQEHENWYQFEKAYERLQKERKGLLSVEYPKELREHDVQLIGWNGREATNERPRINPFEVIKPIVRGPKFGSEINDQVLDKFSSAPIWYSAVEGTNLEKTYLKMQNEDTDYLIMQSGRKLGAEGYHSLYNEDGTFNKEPFNNQIKVGWNNYSIQTENLFNDKNQTRGTQITKLFSLDFFDEGKASEEVQGKLGENNRILNELTDQGYKVVLRKLGIADKGTHYEVLNDGKDLRKALSDEAFSRDMADNIRDVFRPDKDGKFPIPFEATSEYTKIQKVLYSIVDRKILSPKHNGGQKTQMSALGWESATEGRRLAIKTGDGYKDLSRDQYNALSEEDKKDVVFTSSKLHFYTKEEPWMGILLPNHFKEQLRLSGSKRTDAEILKYLNSTKEGQKILEGIGFRIPTQGMNQIEAFRIEGFLSEEYGNTVVVPSEITTKAGSDFDIDKLNTYLRNVYIGKDGFPRLISMWRGDSNDEAQLKDFYEDHILERYKRFKGREAEAAAAESASSLLSKIFGDDIEDEDSEELSKSAPPSLEEFLLGNKGRDVFDINKEFNRFPWKKVLENEYIDNMEWFIKHPENFERLVEPTEGGDLKKIASTIDEITGNKSEPDILSLNYLSKQRQAFMSAKKWIGIIVNAVTSHAQAQRTNIFIKAEDVPLSSRDSEILGLGPNQKEIKILLPHNTGENGLPNLSKIINRASVPISRILNWFTTAMVDVAKDPYITSIIHNRALVPDFAFLIRAGVPVNHLTYFMNQPIIREYMKFANDMGYTTGVASSYLKGVFLRGGQFPEVASKRAKELDADSFKSNIEDFYAGRKLTEAQNAQQRLALDEFLKYHKIAEKLFNLTMATNWDTADLKTGDAIYKKQAILENERKANIFSSPDKILNSTGIGRIAEAVVKMKQAIQSTSRLENPLVRRELDGVLARHTNVEGYQDPQEYEKTGAQITNSFIDYLIQTDSKLNRRINDLVIDSQTSVANKIEAIQEDPDKLAALNNNPIFENLRTQTSNFVKGGDNVRLSPFPKGVFDKDQVTDYLRELKEIDPDLYGRVVRLGLLQGTGKINNLLSFIPTEDFAKALEPLIGGNLQKAAENYRTNYNFERGNWKDDTIVPEAKRLKVYRDYNNPTAINSARLFPEAGGRLLRISEKYNPDLANKSVIKVRRTLPVIGDKGIMEQNRYDIIQNKTVSGKVLDELRKKGEFGYRDFVGYQKVLDENGEPIATIDPKDKTKTYTYRQVNLMGNGDIAEHYNDGRESIFDNDTVHIKDYPDKEDTISPAEPEAPKGPTTVPFTRHGQTPEDVKGQHSGTNDIPLTEKGKKTSQELGKQLKARGIDKIYASPTKRGVQSAEETGIPYEVVDGLKAWNIGDIAGTAKFDEAYYVNHPDEAVPGGESFNSFMRHVKEGIDEVTKKASGSYTILTHSNVLRLVKALQDNGGEWTEKAKNEYLKNKSPKNDEITDYTWNNAGTNKPVDFERFKKEIIENILIAKDSSFDYRITISTMTQAEREKAIMDIGKGKKTAGAKKLLAAIKEMYDNDVVPFNRGRGNQAESLNIPMSEYFKNVITPEEGTEGICK